MRMADASPHKLPSTTPVLEVGASALGFWEYQKRQEIAYQQRRVAHKDKKNHDIVTAANEKLVRAQNVINSQRQRLHAAREQLRRKVAEASSLMGEVKETTRQRDRFSELYNAARGRAVTAPQVRSPRPMTAAALTRQSHDRPNGSSAKTPISQARSAKSLVPAPSLRRSPGHRFASLRSTTPGLTTRTPVAARLSPMRRVPATPSLRGFSPLVSRRDPTGRRRGRRTPRTPRSPAHNSFVVLGAAGRDSR